MSDETKNGVCPHCGRTSGQVGRKCDEAVCHRQGYHYIPESYARVLEESDYADPEIGRMVDRYLLAGKIGQGGMGAVYLALQLPLEREVALKMIPGVTMDETSKGRFEREAKAISILYHPNIVQLFEYGFNPSSGAPFMALEYVKGGRELMDVMVALRESGIPWAADRVQRIFGQVLSALQTAHTQGLVHRDIKPQNIMLVDVEGNPDFVKILDFGLARTLQHMPGMDRLTGTGTVVGTPQYIAPEQLVAGREIDHRSDLYSVGAALFEVVTGLTAYPGVDPRAVLALKLDPDYDPVSRIPEDALHPPLRRLLERTMVRDPDRRFESATEMRGALVEALEGAPPLGRASKIMGGSAALLAQQMGSEETLKAETPAPEQRTDTPPPDPGQGPTVSEPEPAPGTMEISSFERPTSDGFDSMDEDLEIPQRAPMKLIVAGALTGIVLLAAALVAVFHVLPSLPGTSGQSTDASAASRGTEDDVSAPGGSTQSDASTTSPQLSWVALPEGPADASETSGQEQSVQPRFTGRKKKVSPPDDDDQPSPDDDDQPSPDDTTEEPPQDDDSGDEEPGADPPLALIKKQLDSLSSQVASCLPSAHGKVTVAVAVNPQTGRPSSVKVSGFYPGGVQTTQCIKKVIQTLQVPPFTGEKVAVAHVFKFQGSADEELPETLTKAEANKKLAKAKGWLMACSGGTGGKVKVQVTVAGKTGKVTEAVVMNPPFAATEQGDCMERALKKMLQFPRFARESDTFTHVFSL